MIRGAKRFRHALALVLLVAGARNAWATRLDKTACADLNAQLSSLLASGLKEDMDKGAAWASANLSPERLVSINRVIELQGLLEFRCGSAPGHNVAKAPNGKSPEDKSPAKAADGKASTAKSNGEEADDAAPATKPSQGARTLHRKRGSAATTPELPPVVPVSAEPAVQPPRVNTQPTTAATATSAKPASEVNKTAATVPAAVLPTKAAPQLDKTAATTPPTAPQPPQASKVAPVSTTPQAASEAKKPTTAPVPVTAAPTRAKAQALAVAPGDQKTATKKKPTRRDSTSAYVSPKDVTPFLLPTGN